MIPNNLLIDLVGDSSLVIQENFAQVIIKKDLGVATLGECLKWIDICKVFNQRDEFSLFFDVGGNNVSHTRAKDGSGPLQQLHASLGDAEIRVSLNIDKSVQNAHLSIYFIEAFDKYLEQESLENSLDAIGGRFNGELFLEVYSQIERFGSKKIVFYRSESFVAPINIDREGRLQKQQLFSDNCVASNFNKNLRGLLPSDFTVTHSIPFNGIRKFFNAACSTLSLMYLANACELKSRSAFSFKFYGYKAVVIEGVEADRFADKWGLLNKIYEWAYEGGNGSDKLGLVRNIFSINLDSNGHPRIDEDLMEAIKSNYQIYLRGNIQSYLEVKNKIGELLVDFIGKTSLIADELFDSLKNNVAIVVTFLLTVVVVNGLKDNGVAEIFSNTYLCVVILLVIVSGAWLIFLRLNLNRRFDVVSDSMSRILHANYGRVLMENEINQAIKPSIEANRKYLEEQICSYTKVWAILLSIFLVIYSLGNIFMAERNLIGDRGIFLKPLASKTDASSPISNQPASPGLVDGSAAAHRAASASRH